MLRPLCIGIGLVLAAAPASAQSWRTLHSFDGAAEGTSTSAPLIQASDGLFYGVNRFDGPNGRGTLFRMTSNGTVTVMHAFTGGDDGATPGGQLIQAPDGHLYGTAAEGGLYNRGVAFRITLAGDFTVLHAFGDTADAGRTPGALIRSAGGEFYGTTCTGGASDHGTVFRMTDTGETTTVYSLTDGDLGRCPFGLLIATDGNFYGTASGGTLGVGIAFRLTRSGGFTTLHNFVRSAEGGSPNPLIQSRLDGLLYGTTRGGGLLDFSAGILYRMTTNGAFEIVHTFGSGGSAGAFPAGRLVEGTDGSFYGVTENGGLPFSYYTTTGTVFRVTRGGVHTALRLLRADFDGMNPQTGLLQGSDGHLYGSASYGGFGGDGTIFRVDTYLCTNTIEATYTPEFQSLNLRFGFQSAGAGTWSVWALTAGGLAPLWSVAIPPVSLPNGFGIGYNVAPVGPVLFITRLDVPGFGTCGGVAYVDTGSTAARTSIR